MKDAQFILPDGRMLRVRTREYRSIHLDSQHHIREGADWKRAGRVHSIAIDGRLVDSYLKRSRALVRAIELGGKRVRKEPSRKASH